MIFTISRPSVNSQLVMNNITIHREEEIHNKNRRYILYIEFCKHFLVTEIVSEWKHREAYNSSSES
jgi:hypothetical protein